MTGLRTLITGRHDPVAQLPLGFSRVVLTNTQTGFAERFLLYTPVDLEPGETAPLLVGFHSFSVSEDDLLLNTTFFDEAIARKWYMMAPRGIFDINFGVTEAQMNVEDALDWVVENATSVDESRIYAVGFSMGGGWAGSYGARHIDTRSPMFSAFVNHTGGMSLRHTWFVDQTARGALEFVLGGTPFEEPFKYSQVSSIDLDHNTEEIDTRTDMARNLTHIPVRTFFALNDPVQYLTVQSNAYHNHLTAIGGDTDLQNAFGQNPPHNWNVMSEAQACNFLEAQDPLTFPSSGRTLADRDDRFFYFDVKQDVAATFTPFTWAVDTNLNRVDLSATENLASVSIDVVDAGLDPTDFLRVGLESMDETTDDLVLEGYPDAPTQVRLDNQIVTQVAIDGPGGWWHDPATQTIHLPDPTTPSDEYHEWVVNPTPVDPGSPISVSVTSGVVANGIDSSEITITVRNTNGEAVCGEFVSISSDGTGTSIVPSSGTTDVHGQIVVQVASTTAELKTITISTGAFGAPVVLSQQPTIEFIADAANLSASLSTIETAPSTGLPANGVSAYSVTVTVVDANGNPVSGQEVEIAATGSGNVLTQPAVPTDANGQTVGMIATTIVDEKTITATVNPLGVPVVLDVQPSVSFIGDSANISPSLSTATATPADFVFADGLTNSTIDVVVRDVNGNPVPIQTVVLFVSGAGATITQPGITGLDGQTSGTVRSTIAELKTVTITVDPTGFNVQLDDQPTIGFIPEVSASLSSVSVVPGGDVTADGSDAATVTVTVRDVGGNPVAGQTVQIGSDGSGNVINQPPTTTDGAGIVTATIASTVAELKTLTATVNPGGLPVVLDEQPTVGFIADVASASLSSVVADPALGLIADGVETSTLTVTVRDANGNPVEGQTVEIASDGTGNTITQPAGPTDSSGTATATIASTTSELKTLTVTVDPLGAPVVLDTQPTVLFSEDVSASLSSVVASPDTGLVADGVELSTVTVTVRDAGGVPVEGQIVELSSDGTGNVITQPAGPTDSSGIAVATIAATAAELKTLSVTVNPGGFPVLLDAQPTVDFIADADNVSATLSTAVALPAIGVVADGADTSTVTVTVVDVNGNPIEGKTVEIASDGTGNTITQPAGPTDAAGIATATIASSVVELKTITATVDPLGVPVVLTMQPTVDFVPDVSASLSTGTASPMTGVVADGVETSTITITVRDAGGTPLAGQTVEIAADGTGNTLTQPAGPTDGSGVATATIASTTAELKTITVTVNPGVAPVVLTDMPTVDFVADPDNVSAALSTVVASPDFDVVADGVTTSLVTVTVVDVNGNPVEGQTVELASDGTANTLTQPAGPTDASGVATATIATTAAELKTLTATVDPLGTALVLDAQPTVTFIGDASTISASGSSVGATTGIVADGVATSLVTITVRDANGNGVPGQTVEIASDGTGNTLTQPAGPTDSAGAATATLASTVAELKTLTATVDPGGAGTVLDDQPQAEFLADADNISASLSTVIAAPGAGVTADGVDLSTITVTVVDANGNPLAGETVEIAATGTGNVITQPAGPTDVAGVAMATIASTVAEEKTLTATVDPLGSPVVLDAQPMVVFAADPATISGAMSSVDVSTSFGALADGSDAVTITVTVRDALGNPVEGQTVAVAATGSGNTLTQPAGPTDSAGEATATLQSSAAERKTVSATVNPGPSEVAVQTAVETEFCWPLLSAYYVRTSGSDLASGTSAADAWATLSFAATQVAPGDTVYVGAGTYEESVVLTVPGTSEAPISFIADVSGTETGDAGEVLVDGTGYQHTIQVSGASYIVIDGFTLTGAQPGTFPGGAVDLACSPTSGVVVRNNQIYGNGRGVDVLTADNAIIENNRISSNAGAVADGVRVRDSNGVTIVNNLIYNNIGHGIRVTSGSVGVAINANTLYLNAGDQVHVTGEGTTALVFNNILSTGFGAGIRAVNSGAATSLHNLVWNHSGGDWVGVSSGTGDVSSDPLFFDPSGPDAITGGAGGADDLFQIDDLSEANNAGITSAPQVVLSDGTSMADRTTRLDGGLDGTDPDGLPLNLGFHYPAETDDPTALDDNDARLVYGIGLTRQVGVRAFDMFAGNWLAEGLAPPTTATVKWAVAATSPFDNDEELVAVLGDTGSAGELELLRWTGRAWQHDWSSSGIASEHADKRSFDLAIESVSGDALAVYSDGTDLPVCRARVAGVWGPEEPLPLNHGGFPTITFDEVRWVELEPRPGTDEIALAYVDADNFLGAIVWDGTQWIGSTAITLDIDVKQNTSTQMVHNRAFDVAWEEVSGDLMVAWGRHTSGGFMYSILPSGTSNWTLSAAVSAPSGAAHFVDLATEPGADRIAGGFFDMGGVEAMGLATWDGNAWVDAVEADAQIADVNSTGTGDFPGAVGWLGASGIAVCVYADDNTGAIDWAQWSSGSGWTIQSDFNLTGKGLTESVQLESIPGIVEVLVVLADDAGELFAARFNGVTWAPASGGAALSSGLSSTTSKAFGFAVK